MTSFSLKGKKGLVVGIANEHSIAYGCSKAFRDAGADLAITYLNEKSDQYVRPLAESLGADIYLPCDVTKAGELEAVYDAIRQKWGKLDFILHSIAFAKANDLQGRVVDCSAEGFGYAMDISVHSFIRMAHLAEPLMADGGSMLAMSYYGADEVVENYNMMGPVKAALESSARYVAAELGPKNIRVNVLSPGPVPTRAASGIARFNDMIEHAKVKAPLRRLVSIEEVGDMAAFLVSDCGKAITGGTHYIDGGYSIID